MDSAYPFPFFFFLICCAGSWLLCWALVAGLGPGCCAGSWLLCWPLSCFSEWGPLSSCSAWVSRSSSSSYRAQALVLRLQQWQPRGSVVSAPRLQSTGSLVAAHMLSCPMARGVFPDQRSNSCFPHWQVDSLYHWATREALLFVFFCFNNTTWR